MGDYEELQHAIHTLDKRFSLKHFYYSSIDYTIWYVYYNGKRICHISIIGTYLYMNDCIDGAKWNKGITWEQRETSPIVAGWVINQANDFMRTLNALENDH